MKYYNIPIFLPELACPFRCVYCNQFSIAGKSQIPDPEQVRNTIETHLKSFKEEDRFVEVAFFGGNFTGLPEKMQDDYLRTVAPYLEKGLIQGIRCSTRPDYIKGERLKTLKKLGMRNIELGAQSTDNEVLRLCGRGHNAETIRTASEMILAEGLTLGLQMMVGLPGSSFEKDFQTAADIVALGAKETRIYPCLVIKDTVLEKRFQKGSYQPLSIEEAIQRSADIYSYFTENDVTVLRVGLHPSEELDNGDCVAGPYHRNFAEMVFSELWRRKMSGITASGDSLKVFTHPSQRTHAIGYQAANRKMLLERYSQVDFIADDFLDSFRFKVKTGDEPKHRPLIIASSMMPEGARHALRNLGDILWLDPVDFVYPSIASHPDIFFFQAAKDQLVFAPNTPKEWIARLHKAGVKLMRGQKPVGSLHPETTHYNAVGTQNRLIHQLRHTDERILRLYEGKQQLDVKQSYTRCNLLSITEQAFITSDLDIYRKLTGQHCEVLFIDPNQIHLEGHDYGFFPGCCGVFRNQFVVCGNTSLLKEKQELDEFLSKHGFSLIELYDGELTDLGSIFFLEI